MRITLGSQGCADKGLCYPPRRQVLQLELKDGGAAGLQALAVRLLPEQEDGTLVPLEDLPGTDRSQGLGGVGGAIGDRFAAALGSGSLLTVAAVFAALGEPVRLAVVDRLVAGDGVPLARGDVTDSAQVDAAVKAAAKAQPGCGRHPLPVSESSPD